MKLGSYKMGNTEYIQYAQAEKQPLTSHCYNKVNKQTTRIIPTSITHKLENKKEKENKEWTKLHYFLHHLATTSSRSYSSIHRIGLSKPSDWASEQYPLGVSAGVWGFELEDPPSSTCLRMNPPTIETTVLKIPILICPLLGGGRLCFRLRLELNSRFSIFDLRAGYVWRRVLKL